MTGIFTLSRLGNYRIERTEDYDQCPFDKSYCEIIRVKGSRIEEPAYKVESHMYKYSETELCLYLKDKKNIWRPLGKLLNEDIDISDDELILIFPAPRFKEIARIVPFIRKRGLSGKPELAKVIGSKTQFKSIKRHKVEQNNPDSVLTGMKRPITLEAYEGGLSHVR